MFLCVCACVRIMWACYPEHNEGQFQPRFLWISKESAQYIEQCYNSNSSSGTTQVNLTTPIYIERPCSPFSTCDTPGISSQPHPAGEPCTCIHTSRRLVPACLTSSGLIFFIVTIQKSDYVPTAGIKQVGIDYRCIGVLGMYHVYDMQPPV